MKDRYLDLADVGIYSYIVYGRKPDADKDKEKESSQRSRS